MAAIRGGFINKLQRRLIILVAVSFGVALILGFILLPSKELGFSKALYKQGEGVHPKDLKGKMNQESTNSVGKPMDEVREQLKPTAAHYEKHVALPKPDYRVHVFYYPWYGNSEIDGVYLHWNHEYIQHWNKQEAEKWPKGRHKPPADIGANFYPELGPYSSTDRDVVLEHMKQIRSAGIGVLSVSWYPAGMSDHEGRTPDALIPLLLELAHQFELKVCMHIEPYEGRTAATMKKNMEYIFKKYGSHPAFYKHTHNGKELPLYYVYDSYMLPASEWQELLKPSGSQTLRGTEYDAIMIGLLAEEKHKMELLLGGFDGFYTYFASHGFTYGSSTFQWNRISNFAQANNLLFIPSCGPGYIDTRVRPWNARNTKSRKNGEYYDKSWSAAINVKPPFVSITSFNEWHEGTQIEKAIPKSITDYKYEDYQPNPPDFYLALTRKWIFKYSRYKRS